MFNGDIGQIEKIEVGIYRFVARRRTHGRQCTFEPSSPAPMTPAALNSLSPAPAIASPPTTNQLVEYLRSIDWFQFEQLVGLVYRK